MLTDAHGRSIDYLRLSVTDRCDLRCFYCLPKGAKEFCDRNTHLSLEEIRRLIAIFVGLGVERVRLTGGEPLVRKDIVEICRAATHCGVADLSLSTNGTRLKPLAAALAGAGVSRINVSLDTIDPERFARITGGGKLQPVLDGLSAAADAGIAPIKINTVVMAGVNHDELEALVDFCAERNFTLRFIETMPVGSGGRQAANHYLDLGQVRRRLEERYTLLPDAMPGGGPAEYLRVVGSETRIGFITPMSRHFCDTCNRVRVGADGTLYTCLGRENSAPLAPLLRNGSGDETVCSAVLEAIANKPQRHRFDSEAPLRPMSTTGG